MVGLPLCGGEWVPAAGLEPGDDHGVVVWSIVEADEAEVGDGAQAVFVEFGADVIVAGGGDLAGGVAVGCRDPQ